ncbi:non-ribosomal peptide synthetase [Beggiatoa sp. PS]|nr:non-ribosomal peptide synthetase [Beggiatoa sp. PS]
MLLRKNYDSPLCLHQLFEAQVERTPNAIAVVFENKPFDSAKGGQLTYHELNIRANQLAYYLKKQAIGPEVLVGLCVERSLEMVIGLLGILKAGGLMYHSIPGCPKNDYPSCCQIHKFLCC